MKKFAKVVPTVTYFDFGPPLLPPSPCFGATRRRDELARPAGRTVLKFEVCHDDTVKNTHYYVDFQRFNVCFAG